MHFTLLLLASIVLAGRVGSHLAVHWGQAAAVGEIIVGIALGLILFGRLFPGAFDYVFRSASYGPTHILPQLGLILLMFQIGMGCEFAHLKAREHHQSMMRIAIASMVLPFAAGYALGYGDDACALARRRPCSSARHFRPRPCPFWGAC
ncbi:MAG: cation:proton antiporter [Brachymonas sp.]|nr:cation:proton antiporter [Brachymonas sp.]